MTNRPKPRGFALMLVMLEMVLIAALWGVAYRQLAATVRFVAYLKTNLPQGVEIHKPLACALNMLETGDPPDGGSGVYTCNLTILTSSGPAYFIVTYQMQPSDGKAADANKVTWTVTSTQQAVTSSEMAAWNSNLMPSTFAN